MTFINIFVVNLIFVKMKKLKYMGIKSQLPLPHGNLVAIIQLHIYSSGGFNVVEISWR